MNPSAMRHSWLGTNCPCKKCPDDTILTCADPNTVVKVVYNKVPQVGCVDFISWAAKGGLHEKKLD